MNGLKLRVNSVKDAIRGESPLAGTPSLIIDIDEDGTEVLGIDDVKEIVDGSIGEVVTLIGKPFRQLNVVAKFLPSFGKAICIETSGRVPPEMNKREYLVPIVDKTALVIKPRWDVMIRKGDPGYNWFKQYRFTEVYWKFEWQGSDEQMVNMLNMFYKEELGKDIIEEIQKRRVILMPKNINDAEECRNVWAFCLKYRLRYSGREYMRLYSKGR